jgi:hypothetical protein
VGTRERLGVPRIVLGAAGMVAIAVVVHRLGIDRVDPLTVLQERPGAPGAQQPIRPLDGELHRRRRNTEIAQPLRQEVDTLDTVRDPERAQLFGPLVRDEDIMMLACPIHSDIYWHAGPVPLSPCFPAPGA